MDWTEWDNAGLWPSSGVWPPPRALFFNLNLSRAGFCWWCIIFQLCPALHSSPPTWDVLFTKVLYSWQQSPLHWDSLDLNVWYKGTSVFSDRRITISGDLVTRTHCQIFMWVSLIIHLLNSVVSSIETGRSVRLFCLTTLSLMKMKCWKMEKQKQTSYLMVKLVWTLNRLSTCYK